jgi:hypothetical protein
MRLCLFFALLGYTLSTSSCTSGVKKRATPPAFKKSIISIPKPKENKILYLKNDSICVVINKKIYQITNDKEIVCDSFFAAIYIDSNDSIRKSKVLMLKNLLFFTTYVDLGMGYRSFLFVYDIDKQRLIRDYEFKRNYLYSAVGVFFIDTTTNNIFSINKPDWFTHPKIGFTTTASMYTITDNRFKYRKGIYEVGELDGDSALSKFYKRSLTNNAEHGKIVPKNWSNPANWSN